MADCRKCKHNYKPSTCEPKCNRMCDGESDFEPITKYDQIHAMSIEELANTLVQDIPCKICEYWSKEISSCNAPFGFMCTKGYAEALYLKWLQSEAE